MDKVTVKFKKLTETAITPEYKSVEAAGMDLFADEDVVVNSAHSAILPQYFNLQPWALIKTGIAIELPVGYEAQVRPRSGLAFKHGITVLNTPGTIDSDYRGDVGVILINHSNIPFNVKKGDRIAQLVITPVSKAVMTEVLALDDSDRGAGGFGSSGTRG